MAEPEVDGPEPVEIYEEDGERGATVEPRADAVEESLPIGEIRQPVAGGSPAHRGLLPAARRLPEEEEVAAEARLRLPRADEEEVGVERGPVLAERPDPDLGLPPEDQRAASRQERAAVLREEEAQPVAAEDLLDRPAEDLREPRRDEPEAPLLVEPTHPGAAPVEGGGDLAPLLLDPRDPGRRTGGGTGNRPEEDLCHGLGGASPYVTWPGGVCQRSPCGPGASGRGPTRRVFHCWRYRMWAGSSGYRSFGP